MTCGMVVMMERLYLNNIVLCVESILITLLFRLLLALFLPLTVGVDLVHLLLSLLFCGRGRRGVLVVGKSRGRAHEVCPEVPHSRKCGAPLGTTSVSPWPRERHGSLWK